jgi:hypothetical protein
METSNEKSEGTMHTATKWFTDANSTVIDVYNKQLSLVYGFYSNLFNSFGKMNSNSWLGNMNGTKDNRESGIFGMPFSPFSFFKMNNHSVDQSTDHITGTGTYKKMEELNKLCSARFQNQCKHMQENLNELNEKLHDFHQKDWSSKSNLLNAMMLNYTKQMDLSRELNQQFMEELANLFNASAQQNKKFSPDVFKTPPQADHHQEREENHHTVKKPTKAEPVHTHSRAHAHHDNHRKH